jgi:protein-tyrosine-phosphatase
VDQQLPMTEMRPNPPAKNWRRFVPEGLRKERGIYLRLGPKAGPIYARLRLGALLGIRRGSKMTADARSILFVCFGNIMRSPMAEALLRHELQSAEAEGFNVVSAGMHAIAGNAAHPWALEAAQGLGLSLSNHRAQPVTPELIDHADAVYAMDFQNQAELLAQYPHAAAKIFLLGAYADGALRHDEIPDPYFGDVDSTRECYGVLQSCVRKLTAQLLASPNPSIPNRVAVGL